jgi:hypothetical protein
MARKSADAGKLKEWKMYKSLNGVLAVIGLAAATLALSGPANADGVGVGVHVGGVGVGVGLGVGDVAYAYQDGYWDRDHRWHEWRNDEEMRQYKDAHRDRYRDYRHDRDGNDGYRD